MKGEMMNRWKAAAIGAGTFAGLELLIWGVIQPVLPNGELDGRLRYMRAQATDDVGAAGVVIFSALLGAFLGWWLWSAIISARGKQAELDEAQRMEAERPHPMD